MNRSPSLRRFILIGIALITAIMGTTAVLIWIRRDDAIAAYLTATTNLGNGMSQQTSGAIASVDRVLSKIQAHLTASPDATVDQIRTAMLTKAGSDLLVVLGQGLTNVNALALVDTDGRIENSSGPWSSTGHDVSDQDFFIHFSTNDDRGVFVSRPTKSVVNGKWIAYLARRINDAHGTFAGIVAAEFSLAALEDFYDTAMPVRRSVSLVRRDGIVLVRYPPQEDEIGKKIPDRSAWYAVVAEGGGAYHASDYFTGKQILAFVRPLNNLPLVVQASVADAEVLADWPRQILWLAFGGAAAAVGVVLLLRYLARQVDRLERSRLELAEANERLGAVNAQLQETQAVAEAANKAKSEFLGNMSHELRTPLNAIIGFSEVIKDQAFGPVGQPRYREYANDIYESGRSLLELINDILDLSKVEAGKMELQRTFVNVSEVMHACIRLVEGRAAKSNVRVYTSFDPHLPLWFADEGRLRQIGINLLSNAVKFTPAGGKVVCSANLDEKGALAIAVADTGVGMSPSEIKIALERFGQTETSLSRRNEGTGLGLPLAKNLVELHGGVLSIASVPGEGTTVTLTLPPHQLPKASAPISARKQAASQLPPQARAAFYKTT